MLALFKAEFIRYRKWAILLLIAQLILWLYMSKISVLLDANNARVNAVQLLLLISSLAFGLVQMHLHKRKNHWTQLLQRPLASGKIYLALAGAAVVNILIAVPLAWLLVVVGFDSFTTTVVDQRHYDFVIFSAGKAILAYLLGSFIILSASRGAVLLAILLLVFFLPTSQNLWLVFSAMAVIICYLAYLNFISFKPALAEHPKSGLATLLMAVPMQVMIVHLLVFSSVIFYHIPRAIIGDHPAMVQSEGTYDYWRNSVPQEERIGYFLKDTGNENNAWYGNQAQLAQFNTINTIAIDFAKKGQLHTSDGKYSLNHKSSQSLWIFSHDKMLLQGTDNTSGIIVGWLGQQGFINSTDTVSDADRFTHIPYLLQDKFILTDNTIYQVDYNEKTLSVKSQMQGDERFIGLPQFNQTHVTLVSTEQTYIFEREDFFEEFEIAVPSYELPHPVSLDQISLIESYRLVDGFILSYMGYNYHGFDRPGAEIFYAQLEGNIEKIHNIKFKQHNYPDLIRHLGYIASPLYYPLYRSFFHMGESTAVMQSSAIEVYSRKMPMSVNISVAILQLFSAISVFFLAKRSLLNKRSQFVWTIMTAVVGLPALLSFFLLNKVGGVHIVPNKGSTPVVSKPEKQ
jgi:hypothetical protein